MIKNTVKIWSKVKNGLGFDFGTRTVPQPWALLRSSGLPRSDEWAKAYPKRHSPMLPFQIFSSFFSSAIWLLVSEVWRECVPVAAAMEGTDRAGRRLALSTFPGSFRERCWRTLIMASFSIIFAWRFFILPKYECSAYRDGQWDNTGSSWHPKGAEPVCRDVPCCSAISKSLSEWLGQGSSHQVLRGLMMG